MIYLNDVPVNTTMFPDNTSQVWKHEFDGGANVIRWDFSHEGEFLQLAQLKTLIDYQGGVARLHISYLPYGRQDKPVSNESTFALHTFAKLLNALKFPHITIMDPHSHIACNLIENASPRYPKNAVNVAFNAVGADLVCYPDGGAAFKYAQIYNYPYIAGRKVRESLTGNIIRYELVTIRDLAQKTILIVDDICDGGATFVHLAAALFEAEVAHVHLFVTHGLFTKGLRPLRDAGIDKIFTRNGIVNEKEIQQ